MEKHKKTFLAVSDWYAKEVEKTLGFDLDYWIGEDINRDLACYADYIFLSFADMQIIIDHIDTWTAKYGSREAVGQAIIDWQNWMSEKDEDTSDINLWTWLNGLRPEDLKPTTSGEMLRLEQQSKALRKVQEIYSGRNIDNIIVQIESRIKELSKILEKEMAADMEHIKQTQAYKDFEEVLKEAKDIPE
jgi:hypothetical protein